MIQGVDATLADRRSSYSCNAEVDPWLDTAIGDHVLYDWSAARVRVLSLGNKAGTGRSWKRDDHGPDRRNCDDTSSTFPARGD
ncbi:MAG TPA: hypothetical protein VJ935_10585, partial [Acidimicrobiia bacterium]|nr:hypothetical protein [Acidimicrobiia bacterium]